MTRLLGFLLMLAITLPQWSCGGQVSAGGGLSGAEGGSTLDGSLLAVINRMAGAPWGVPYSGNRVVSITGPSGLITFTESVAADGAGGFQLQPGEVLSGAVNAHDFLTDQEQGKGFQYRYRGFQVQDAQLLQLNYTVSVLSNQGVATAGIPCTQLHIQRKDAGAGVIDRLHYVVNVDPQTGVVLAWTQLDEAGNTVSMMEFANFTYGEPAVEMYQSPMIEQPLNVGEDLKAQLGFDVLRPGMLPRGYRMVTAAKVVTDETPWVRMVFSDGVESLFLMHREPELLAGVAQASTLGSYENGERTVLMGTVNGFELIAEGKFGSVWMQDFVSSCF
ncbi:MAG: hypothetical protein R3F17_07880 [Planctomycetota bacterium]